MIGSPETVFGPNGIRLNSLKLGPSSAYAILKALEANPDLLKRRVGVPITTIGSYLPVMQEFIAHWTDVNAAINPDTLTLRGGFTLANFTTARNDIQAAVTAIEPADNARQAAGEDRDLKKAALAIRLGQLKQKVVCVEMDEVGGVCLNWGCIPSKAIISASHQYEHARHSANIGIKMSGLEVDPNALQTWKEGIVKKLTGGVRTLLRANGAELIAGRGTLVGPNQVEVETD